MIWQDWALAAINLGFVPTLWAMIRSPTPPPMLSSLPTALLLAAVAAILVTLGLWLAATCQLAMAGQWGWLAWRRWHVTCVGGAGVHWEMVRVSPLEDADVGDH